MKDRKRLELPEKLEYLSIAEFNYLLKGALRAYDDKNNLTLMGYACAILLDLHERAINPIALKIATSYSFEVIENGIPVLRPQRDILKLEGYVVTEPLKRDILRL